MSNLTATVREPILSYPDNRAKSSSTGNIYNNLFDYHTGQYSHKTSATIGYDSMDMDISVSDSDTRSWMTHGIGRHIEVYGSSGIVWEGFVNSVSIVIGPVTMTIGPLMDISNSIKVTYTTKRWDTNPPIGGEAAETAFNSDDESVDRWGTFQSIITGGEGYETTMEALRDSKLNELSWPKTVQEFSFSGNTKSISISCLGYYHYLNRYLFNGSVAKSGGVNISEKIADVLDDDPDALFSSSNSSIETNTLQVPDFDDGEKTGMQAVQELVGLGFASGQRALFQVGPGRTVTYSSLAVDREPKYVYNIFDEDASIRTRAGYKPKLWDISVGEWLRVQSLNAKPFSSSLPRHSDPGFIFLESITYSAPDSIKVESGLGNTLKAKIGSMGLAFYKG